MRVDRVPMNGRQVIAFFMTKTVEKGVELVWEYGPDYFEVDDSE